MEHEALTVAVSVNDDTVLERNLLRSPNLLEGGRNELLVRRDYPSASLAYNSALDAAKHDLIVFVHQDVYLPESWLGDLRRCLAWLANARAEWGVLGCYGSRKGAPERLGRVYTTGLGRHGRPLARPEPIETLDEIVLVVRKSSGLRFDPALPHFHLYGTDICLTAKQCGRTSYAFQGYCVHNTNQPLILPSEFYACYRYIRRKWARDLPIYTSCIKISLLNEAFHGRRIVEAKQRMFGMRSRPAKRVDDPRVYAAAGEDVERVARPEMVRGTPRIERAVRGRGGES